MTRKQIAERWKRLELALPQGNCNKEEIISSLKSLYSLYDPSMLGWLGGLFDREIGGFYYSNSARDDENFFPDIESTGQAIGILENTGVINSYQDIPELVRTAIAYYICSCEDRESGYFYNPQWSKEEINTIKLSRRARDLRCALDLAQICNFEIPHPTFFMKINDKTDNGVPDFLKSEKKFKEYLASKNWEEKIYKSMHGLVSQVDQIVAAGLGDIALAHLESLQDKNTGLFGEGYVEEEYKTKVLKGAISFFVFMKRPIPMYEKVFDYAIKRVCTEKVEDISSLSSSWGTVSLVIRSLTEYGGESGRKESLRLTAKYADKFSELILRTAEKLQKFKKPDGSFSYTEFSSSTTSQTMPVAKENSYEGDVNATMLAITLPRTILRILTQQKIFIPLFTFDDFDMFIKNIK